MASPFLGGESNSKTLSASHIPPRIPRAPYRHAAPSGPWPWQNLDDPIPEDKGPDPEHTHTHDDKTILEPCGACHWKYYPESLFPNWLDDQVSRSKMKELGSDKSTIYHVDVLTNGKFMGLTDASEILSGPGESHAAIEAAFTNAMEQKTYPQYSDERIRLQAFFVKDLSTPVMQLIGTKFNVEPFFWTSSVNWVPSRYQENPIPRKGDHITVVVKFPRAVAVNNNLPLTPSAADLNSGQIIDTQRPLPLGTAANQDATKESASVKHFIITDLLAIHMVRKTKQSTIITYHPTERWWATTAENLRTRTYLAGQSVYWNHIFRKSNDPTFVMLATLWYALYAWDEALETLWNHICEIELKVINTNNMVLTQELHKIRAHLLHYASLLEDFKHSVEFVRDTANPAMEAETEEYSKNSSELLKKECGNLLTQINRLKMSREMWDSRLQNVMHLVFSKVNIEDSRQMQHLTQAAVRDSAAMKQISYLTMVFLPAGFMAAVFGMNIEEINPGTNENLPHYFATAIPLTIVTAWVVIALQQRWTEDENDETRLWRRFIWPYDFIREWMARRNSRLPKDNASELTAVASPAPLRVY